MMIRPRVRPLLAALHVVTLAAATRHAQGDQHTLAQRILSGNVAEQDGAVWDAMALGSPAARRRVPTLQRGNHPGEPSAERARVGLPQRRNDGSDVIIKPR